MERYIIVTTFCKEKNLAGKICDDLLEKNLVARCTVSKVSSKYWWNGKLELANEYKLEFRTIASFFETIKEEIEEIHDYEVPEISAVEMYDANDSFIEWINQYTSESYCESDQEEEEEQTSDYTEDDFGLL